MNSPRIRQQIQTLQSHYTFISSDDLIAKALTEVSALYQLLNEAVEALRRAFGENTELQLEALESDEEGSILRALVSVRPHMENPATLMRGFQQNWWFEHCSRSEASLVFDYGMANGI